MPQLHWRTRGSAIADGPRVSGTLY